MWRIQPLCHLSWEGGKILPASGTGKGGGGPGDPSSRYRGGSDRPQPMSRTSSGPSRSAIAHAGFQLWLLNVVVGTVVGSAWLFRLPEDLSPWTRVYVAFALLSSVAILALLPAAVFFAVHRLLETWWRIGLAQAVAGTCFLCLLYTDTIIYRLLRYHFNGAVLNVALTPGSSDAVQLGWSVWSAALLVASGGTVLQYLFWRWSLSMLVRREEAGRRPLLLLQPRIVILIFLLPAIGIEKGVYAAACIQGDHELQHAARPLPLYPRVELAHLFDPSVERPPRLEVLPREARLAYPEFTPVLPAGGPRPNVLFLVLDSWRRDMFSPELTPRLWELGRDARVFADHAAGGNGTRYGLFTMLYGLHGSYWFKVLEERRPPVLVDALVAAGYDARVLSSASMNFPELLDTAWAGLPRDHVLDDFRGPDGPHARAAYVKDGLVADAFGEWMEERRSARDARPFFAFVLLDAPHQPYVDPGGPFAPTVERLNYLELGRTTEGPELEALVERVFNAYRNCVVHADGTAGRILDSLRRGGALDETLVLVTGDHGEEFQENGFWGHTSNFSPEQIEVPLLLRGPGVPGGREERPTSHLDVPCTILELLGVHPSVRSGYTLGENLLAPPAERARVVAGWSEIGVWTDAGIFRLPLDAEAGPIEVYDRDWNLLDDVAGRCARASDVLEATVRECVRFLELPAQ